MEIARRVFQSYFQDNANPLVRHHIDSYRDLLITKIPEFIKGMNPLTLDLGDERLIKVYIGGKNSDKLVYIPPTDEIGNAVMPHQCRLNNRTYELEIRGQIDIDYVFSKKVESKTFDNIFIGKIPLMLKSHLCYLSNLSSEELLSFGECKYELGGYFIINGSEKVLLTQERLAENMFYATKRRVTSSASPGARTLVEKEAESKLDSSTKGDNFEYAAGLRSVSEDGTTGPFSHFLIIPPVNKKPNDPKKISAVTDFSSFSTNRLAVMTLPGFTQPVPIISVFYALGLSNDQDIYDTILTGIPPAQRSQYDELFMELMLSYDKFVTQELAKEDDKAQDPHLLLLKRQTRTRSKGSVYINLYDQMFPHCQPYENETPPALFRRKAYLLGYMTKIAMEVALDIKPKTDRDHFRFKRLYASGDLVFQEFRRIFKDVRSRMLTELDIRVHFEKDQYSGEKLKELVQEENIGYYWRGSSFMTEISKSFKGKWGGKDGVAQELSRFSFLGTLAQLRRINTEVDKTGQIISMRRIHCSSWGLLCPVDNPDGRDVGLIKSMTILSTISTASPSSVILERIRRFKHFIPTALIHPSTWNPIWTKIHVNSDMIGVITENAEDLHQILLNERRTGQINKFVSLWWNRLENEYIIQTDTGRPSRPIYRENVEPSDIRGDWNSIASNTMDYVDASETEGLRISMEPFSKKYPSEIHGLAILSASSSVVPNSDFDPGTRNAFSCQQVKQACSWYNTAFRKRFDTISTWLNYAQRPLSQTWLYNNIIGCLPYGENPIVALMIYSGYNQEDSVLLNKGSVSRGMFHTTYYHSYDFEEEALESAFQGGEIKVLTSSEFANVATDPRFREIVKRKEGYDYGLLGPDGIILAGSQVTDKTILVGNVTPKTRNGQVIGYTDASFVPKKSQIGVVDSVYRYPTKEGLHAVKIRIAEHRLPVLGDKVSARHGQKGTVGLLVNEEDMPYTSAGLRPDMVVNPHAFPSRMTIGQFVEGMSTKLGIATGSIIDSTPFSTSNRVSEMKELLIKAGLHPYGHEIMYSGHTGEMMEMEIFMGPNFYIRSKLMTEDKINYRTTGPKTMLTRQPVEGRANDGGLRIGEMERDCLISHGISKFINESLMERADKVDVLFQPESGLLDANPELESIKLSTPYALSLLVHELEAMHVSLKLLS